MKYFISLLICLYSLTALSQYDTIRGYQIFQNPVKLKSIPMVNGGAINIALDTARRIVQDTSKVIAHISCDSVNACVDTTAGSKINAYFNNNNFFTAGSAPNSVTLKNIYTSLGIGTTNPAHTLDVVGSINVNADSNSAINIAKTHYAGYNSDWLQTDSFTGLGPLLSAVGFRYATPEYPNMNLFINDFGRYGLDSTGTLLQGYPFGGYGIMIGQTVTGLHFTTPHASYDMTDTGLHMMGGMSNYVISNIGGSNGDVMTYNNGVARFVAPSGGSVNLQSVINNGSSANMATNYIVLTDTIDNDEIGVVLGDSNRTATAAMYSISYPDTNGYNSFGVLQITSNYTGIGNASLSFTTSGFDVGLFGGGFLSVKFPPTGTTYNQKYPAASGTYALSWNGWTSDSNGNIQIPAFISRTSHNTAFGEGTPTIAGDHNTAFGESSLHGNVSGNNNTSIGQNAGSSITTESNNTCIGRGTNIAPGVTGATALGQGALAMSSNGLFITADSIVIPNMAGLMVVPMDTNNSGAFKPVSIMTNGATGSEPSTPYLGQFYFDTTLTKMKFWNGTTWAIITSAP